MKTKQEIFDKLREEHGCGYWNICWEHACPCNISMNHNDVYNEEIDIALKKEAELVVKSFENEFYA